MLLGEFRSEAEVAETDRNRRERKGEPAGRTPGGIGEEGGWSAAESGPVRPKRPAAVEGL